MARFFRPHDIRKVRPNAFKKVAEIAAWSMAIASRGLGPDRGFAGEIFQEKTYRASLAGKQLANGYKKLVCSWFQNPFKSFTAERYQPSTLNDTRSQLLSPWSTRITPTFRNC